MSGTETRPGDYRTTTEVIPKPTPEPNKLIIELTNLGSGSMRTIKRELKVLIEDYGYQKMISGCINVTEDE